MKNILNDIFEKIFVIISHDTLDRLDELTAFFSSENIEFEFIVSPRKKYFSTHINKDIDMGNGAISLLCANESIFMRSRICSYNSILVFEDDIRFIDDYKSKILNFYQNLPTDWEILNLGYHICSNIEMDIPTQPIVGKFTNLESRLIGTHAMAYTNITFNSILEGLNINDLPFDLFLLNNIYGKFNTYYPTTRIAIASSYREYESDKFADYKKYKSSIG